MYGRGREKKTKSAKSDGLRRRKGKTAYSATEEESKWNAEDSSSDFGASMHRKREKSKKSGKHRGDFRGDFDRVHNGGADHLPSLKSPRMRVLYVQYPPSSFCPQP